MITVIGGIKGGTGKTTLATNFAVLSDMHGVRTLLVDADDQRSSSDWADQRESHFKDKPNFPTVALNGKNIHQQIMKFKNDYDHIFVDTGGRDTMSQRSALICADFYIIPFKPRSFDIWTIGPVRELISEVLLINPKLKVIACINQSDNRGVDNEDALKILEEASEFKCIQSMIGNRKVFSNAASQGLGVAEMQDAKAKEELIRLYQEIFPRHQKDISKI